MIILKFFVKLLLINIVAALIQLIYHFLLFYFFLIREMLELLVTLALKVLLDCRECLVSVVPLVFQDLGEIE